MGHRTEEVYLFVVTDPKTGDEGVIAERSRDGQWLPAVCTDPERVEFWRPRVQRIADHYAAPVRLLRFSQRSEVEVLEPREGVPRATAGRCRMCGCTDDRACPGGCAWVAPDLCSSCVRNQ
jgi:acyl-CoA synthetase (AMP-forming)/AMP-acid ligase II